MEEPAGKDEFSKKLSVLIQAGLPTLFILCQILILTLIPIYGFPHKLSTLSKEIHFCER